MRPLLSILLLSLTACSSFSDQESSPFGEDLTVLNAPVVLRFERDLGTLASGANYLLRRDPSGVDVVARFGAYGAIAAYPAPGSPDQVSIWGAILSIRTVGDRRCLTSDADPGTCIATIGPTLELPGHDSNAL